VETKGTEITVYSILRSDFSFLASNNLLFNTRRTVSVLQRVSGKDQLLEHPDPGKPFLSQNEVH
jgi:hypothetical protein